MDLAVRERSRHPATTDPAVELNRPLHLVDPDNLAFHRRAAEKLDDVFRLRRRANRRQQDHENETTDAITWSPKN